MYSMGQLLVDTVDFKITPPQNNPHTSINTIFFDKPILDHN